MPAQLNYGGQFAALEISLADGRSGGFIDNEHSANMISDGGMTNHKSAQTSLSTAPGPTRCRGGFAMTIA
jgi:hypothetical protein